MAGPGDTYAKDTRAYNPEFAAAAGDEDEYDKKIQEVSVSVAILFKTKVVDSAVEMRFELL